jgi:O-antigen ligase
VHGNLWAAGEFTLLFAKRALIFLIFWLVIDSTRKLRGVLTLTVFLVAILAIQGIYMKQNGVGWAGQPMYWEDRIRWVGLWDGANVLSLLFVSTVPFVLEMIFGPWKLLSKLFGLCTGGLILIGMYLAASRGAWVALGVVFLVYFKRRLGRVGLVLAALAIAGIIAFGPSRLMHGSESDKSSSAHRIDMWAEGIDMLKGNPVLGIGKGQFRSYTHMLIAHNTFVQNMGETGMVGLFIWVALAYSCFQNLGMALRHENQLSVSLVSVTRAVLVSFIAYMTASLFISTDFEPFYILIALSSAVLTIARREVGQELPVKLNLQSLRNIALIEFAGVVMVHFAVMFYYRR